MSLCFCEKPTPIVESDELIESLVPADLFGWRSITAVANANFASLEAIWHSGTLVRFCDFDFVAPMSGDGRLATPRGKL
ncbi:hypothetical protein PoB_002961900 [Plakobranchus ocellatus]|uniref:Uncharacterized protein n=1 Tax=Plakobranchus ocellatus TaxID=259542 RepID=A0AAV4A9F5_9GAST|nr:hypothetical protein PoB_002961900 [Plakobranchus ocellatus]